MKELLKTVEKNLQREYPETNPRLEYTYGHVVTENPWQRHLHALIYLIFIKDDKEIKYAISRVSLVSNEDQVEQNLKTIESTIMDSFVNNLLFSLGSINIPEILSGRSELEESLIMK